MINLLPPEVKADYRFARRNVRLRRWTALFVLALVGLGLLGTYGLLTIHQSTVRYNQQIAREGLLAEKQQFAQTQAQVKEISSSFKLVLQVLSKEVLFSGLLKQIAATIPVNANLTGLTISKTTGALDITAIATDYNTATQVQVNLADPANRIFSKADLVSVTCGATASQDPRYPCTVTVRALFGSNNPFLFINSRGTKS